jgi:hypothetical protein
MGSRIGRTPRGSVMKAMIVMGDLQTGPASGKTSSRRAKSLAPRERTGEQILVVFSRCSEALGSVGKGKLGLVDPGGHG